MSRVDPLSVFLACFTKNWYSTKPIAKLLIDEIFTNLLVCDLSQIFKLYMFNDNHQKSSNSIRKLLEQGKDQKNPKSAGGCKAR